MELESLILVAIWILASQSIKESVTLKAVIFHIMKIGSSESFRNRLLKFRVTFWMFGQISPLSSIITEISWDLSLKSPLKNFHPSILSPK